MNQSFQSLRLLANSDVTSVALVNQLAAAEIVDAVDGIRQTCEQVVADNVALEAFVEQLFDDLEFADSLSDRQDALIDQLSAQLGLSLNDPLPPLAIEYKHNPDPDLIFGELAEVDTDYSYERELENEIDRQDAIIDDLRVQLRNANNLGAFGYGAREAA